MVSQLIEEERMPLDELKDLIARIEKGRSKEVIMGTFLFFILKSKCLLVSFYNSIYHIVEEHHSFSF